MFHPAAQPRQRGPPEFSNTGSVRMRGPLPDSGVRHHCRNARCCRKLSRPTEDPRAAFCDAACRDGFYAVHCLVCERLLPDKRTKRARFCGEKCRSEHRRDAFYEARWALRPSPATPLPGATVFSPKIPTKSKPISPDFGDRASRVVGRRDWPIDLVGGNDHRARRGSSLGPRLRAAILAAELRRDRG